MKGSLYRGMLRLLCLRWRQKLSASAAFKQKLESNKLH